MLMCDVDDRHRAIDALSQSADVARILDASTQAEPLVAVEVVVQDLRSMFRVRAGRR